MSVDPSRTLHIWHDFGNKVQDRIRERLILNPPSNLHIMNIQLGLLDDEFDTLFTYYMWMMMQQGINFSTEYMNKIDPSFRFANEWTPADVDLQKQLMDGVKQYLNDWSSAVKQKITGIISDNAGKSADEIGALVADALQTRQTDQAPTLENRGVLIARTELMRAFNSAADSRYKKAGFESVWVTAEDEKVCEICAPKDGQVTEDNPPAHPLCRCVKVPRLKK